MHTPGVLAFLHLLAAAVVQLVLAAWQVTEPPHMSSKAVKGSLVQATSSGVQVGAPTPCVVAVVVPAPHWHYPRGKCTYNS